MMKLDVSLHAKNKLILIAYVSWKAYIYIEEIRFL